MKKVLPPLALLLVVGGFLMTKVTGIQQAPMEISDQWTDPGATDLIIPDISLRDLMDIRIEDFHDAPGDASDEEVADLVDVPSGAQANTVEEPIAVAPPPRETAPPGAPANTYVQKKSWVSDLIKFLSDRGAMGGMISLIGLIAALFVILNRGYPEDTTKWAFGTLGTIVGYWLGG